MNRALTYKYEADGYAYLGTTSVVIPGRDIAMPLLNAEGDRPDDARELAWDIATTLNLASEMMEALEELIDDIWPMELDTDIGPPEEGGTISGPVRAELIAQARDILARAKGGAA